jgi:ribosome-binding factor A
MEFLEDQKGMVTISKVETSRDMKWTKIWISIFNGTPLPSRSPRLRESEAGQGEPPSPVDASGRGQIGLTSFDKKILASINKNIYHIQGELNKKFTTKIIPRLQFFLDTSPRYVEHIEEMIKKIHEEE